MKLLPRYAASNIRPNSVARAPRLFIDRPLHEGYEVAVTAAQRHHLEVVLRHPPNDPVRVFNGRDGEFVAVIWVPAVTLSSCVSMHAFDCSYLTRTYG